MSTPEDWIEDAIKAGNELRELIEEGHQLHRDMKLTLASLKLQMKTIEQDAPDFVNRQITPQIEHALEILGEFVDTSQEKFDKRFQTLQDLLLGRGEGSPALDEVAFAYHLVSVIAHDDTMSKELKRLIRIRLLEEGTNETDSQS
jgi:hypothetical protein